MFADSLTQRMKRAEACARALIRVPNEVNAALCQTVCAKLAPITQGVSGDDLVLTYEGFVTMAVAPSAAIALQGVIAVPGADERGAYGWLVLGVSARPFHSRALSVRVAVQEARHAAEAARALEAYFGGIIALKAAVSAAPWHLLCSIDDARAAGLCGWGTETFLRRARVWWFVRIFGVLPKGLIGNGGGFSRRVIAATLRRKALAEHHRSSQLRV